MFVSDHMDERNEGPRMVGTPNLPSLCVRSFRNVSKNISATSRLSEDILKPFSFLNDQPVGLVPSSRPVVYYGIFASTKAEKVIGINTFLTNNRSSVAHRSPNLVCWVLRSLKH